MASRQTDLHVVALGASAGGFHAIRNLAAGLGSDFPAAIVAVIHTAPVAWSDRIDLLAKRSKLPASLASEGQQLEAGHIYLAPPDRHLLVDGKRLLVRRGPSENNARPAVDPLFRSVAVSYGPRAIAIILSGFSSQDGVSGLEAIKRCGGRTIVQDPEDAEFEGMPDQAITFDSPDHVTAVARMPGLLRRIIAEPKAAMPSVPPEISLEVRIAAQDVTGMAATESLGKRSFLTCPECNGVLWEIENDNLVRYRCHVGHAYSGLDLASAQMSETEHALSAALRVINERIALLRRLSHQAHRRSQSYTVRAWEDRIAEYEGQATAIRKLLLTGRGNLRSEPGEPK